MRDVVAWGDSLVSQGATGSGWICVNAGDSSIYNAAVKAAGPEKSVGKDYAVNLNVTGDTRLRIENVVAASCFRNATLREVGYKSDANVVYGVWRCEEGNVVGEFQLQKRAKPDPVSKTTEYCTFAMFYNNLGIPVGIATDFYGSQ